MDKRIAVSIGGLSFEIEQRAYESLQNYLQAITKHFEAYEDPEIMDDIEGRIAEKLQARLGEVRDVVTQNEVAWVIESLGTVEELTGSEDPLERADMPQDNRVNYQRLYRHPEDKVIGGVAAGIAANFQIDPTWIRLLFVFLVFIGGFGLLAYLLLWLIVPIAKTPAERLAMEGKPLTLSKLEELIDLGQAKKKVAKLADEGKEAMNKLSLKAQALEAKYRNQRTTKKLRNFFRSVFSYLASLFENTIPWVRYLLGLIVLIVAASLFIVAGSSLVFTLTGWHWLIALPGVPVIVGTILGMYQIGVIGAVLLIVCLGFFFANIGLSCWRRGAISGTGWLILGLGFVTAITIMVISILQNLPWLLSILATT